MRSGDLGRTMKTDVIPALRKKCSRNSLKIRVSTFLKETFYQRELSMSRYPHIQSLLLSPKWTKTITLTSDFFPVAPIFFQLFFSSHFQTHILHRILSVKPLNGNSRPQQSKLSVSIFGEKEKTNWGGRRNKMLPVFRYFKTVNLTIVPPMNNFLSHFHQELLFASESLFTFSLPIVRYSIPGHQRQSWLYGVWALSIVLTSTSLLVFQARCVNSKSQTQD